MNWAGVDVSDNGTCDACGKAVNMDAEPPCPHGICTCDMCPAEESCADCRSECAAGDLLPPAQSLADALAEQRAWLAAERAASGYDPATDRHERAEMTETADWCADDGAFSICGTRMREHSRRSEGVKWCFHCRTRHEFWWVVSVPDGMSYYGPSAGMDGVTPECSDLFPGWYREAMEE